MATIGKISVSENKGVAFNRYIGVAPVKVLAVNPKKAELEKLYNTTLEKEPEYVGKTTIDGKEYEQVRIDFICQMVPFTYNGEEITFEDITKVSFFITKRARLSSTNKHLCNNVYGEFAWLPEEDWKNKKSSMEWFSPEGVRVAYQGEEELVGFLKALLNIPSKVFRTQSGEMRVLDNPADAYFQLESIADYFKGNVKELQDIIKMLPEAAVKVCFGVRTTSEGKMYQDVFNRIFLRNAQNNYLYLKNKIDEAKNNGAYASTEFLAEPVKVYEVQATTFSTTGSIQGTESSSTTVEDDSLPF